MRGDFMEKKETISIIDMVKSLVEMAESFEDADRIIVKFTDLRTTKEKLDFLFENFDVAIVGANSSKKDKESKLLTDYEAVLTAIVNKKWR